MNKSEKIFYSTLADLFEKDEYFDGTEYYAFIKNHPKGEVLDLGFGLGFSTVYYAKKGFKVTAVDKDPFYEKDLLRRIKKMSLCDEKNIQFINEDILNLNLEGEKYSVIILENILHFLKPKECKKVFKFIEKVIENNGLCFIKAHHISHPDNKNINDESYFKQFFSEDSLLKYIDEAKFEILSSSIIKRVMPEKQFLKWKKAYSKFNIEQTREKFGKKVSSIELIIQKREKPNVEGMPKNEISISIKKNSS